jgi:hypothetical protein
MKHDVPPDDGGQENILVENKVIRQTYILNDN